MRSAGGSDCRCRVRPLGSLIRATVVLTIGPSLPGGRQDRRLMEGEWQCLFV